MEWREGASATKGHVRIGEVSNINVLWLDWDGYKHVYAFVKIHSYT